MSSFKKTNSKIYSKAGPILTPDNIYWKKLTAPVLVKEFGPIDYIDFSPVEPYHFAVTCSVRVQVYNPITKLVIKNLSRFRENAYGASFRSDGKLLCAGGEEKYIKLFDVNSKSMLRLFKGHTASVHRTFFTNNKVNIVSFSDDKSVKVWDIPTELPISSFSEHNDYVRAGAVSPVSPDVFISGSYDKTVKMYDTRSNSVVFSVDHESPVESTLFLPTGGIFLSAGGTELRVWDAFAGGKLLARISQHHKTITCLRLANDSKRLLSGSLDRHVKIYDLSTYKVVHTLDYPNAILSLAVSNNDETVVAGMIDGLLSVSRKADEKIPTKSDQKTIPYKYISNTHPVSVDTVVSEYKREVQSKHDICLRKFQYSKALDCVLTPYIVNKTPAITISVFQELIRRKGLHKAFAGRDSKFVHKILRFFIKYIGDYRYARVLIDVVNIFLDVYESTISLQSGEIQKMFTALNTKLKDECNLTRQLITLQGAVHMLLAGASVVDDEMQNGSFDQELKPSENAQKNLVISIG